MSGYYAKTPFAVKSVEQCFGYGTSDLRLCPATKLIYQNECFVITVLYKNFILVRCEV